MIDRDLLTRGNATVWCGVRVPDMERRELIELIGMLDELATQRQERIEELEAHILACREEI